MPVICGVKIPRGFDEVHIFRFVAEAVNNRELILLVGEDISVSFLESLQCRNQVRVESNHFLKLLLRCIYLLSFIPPLLVVIRLLAGINVAA